jgi:hypothetical protein
MDLNHYYLMGTKQSMKFGNRVLAHSILKPAIGSPYDFIVTCYYSELSTAIMNID